MVYKTTTITDDGGENGVMGLRQERRDRHEGEHREDRPGDRGEPKVVTYWAPTREVLVRWKSLLGAWYSSSLAES